MIDWMSRKPDGFWKNDANIRLYMSWLGNINGWKEPQDWYACQKSILLDNGGRCVLRRFGGIYQVISWFFPDYQFLPWLLVHVANGFWKDINNCKWYMTWLGKQLGYNSMDDWYNVTSDDFKQHRGGTLLNYYKSCPTTILMDVFPEYKWVIWKFKQVSAGWWDKLSNLHVYMTWLGKQLGYTSMDDWYKTTINDLRNHHGVTLVSKYKNPALIVMNCFPDYPWQMWKFCHARKYWWVDKNNQKQYMSWLFNCLGFRTWVDWYGLSAAHLKDNHGHGLLKLYNNNPSRAVIANFPDHPWQMWKFNKVPIGWWNNKDNQKEYLNWLSDVLGLQKIEDWYKVLNRHLGANYGHVLLSLYQHSMYKVLTSVFPQYAWDGSKFVIGSGGRYSKHAYEGYINANNLTEERLDFVCNEAKKKIS